RDLVWRWSLKLVYVFVSLAASAYFFYSDAKVAQTTGLRLPEPVCMPARQGISTAVVLFHGWNGSADTTWDNFPRLICEDSALSDIDLFVIDYPTFLSRRQLSVTQISRWLYQSFFSDKLRDYSQIHIIAHSMGGPIARNLYLTGVMAGGSKI